MHAHSASIGVHGASMGLRCFHGAATEYRMMLRVHVAPMVLPWKHDASIEVPWDLHRLCFFMMGLYWFLMVRSCVASMMQSAWCVCFYGQFEGF